jgi:hypothetical protein
MTDTSVSCKALNTSYNYHFFEAGNLRREWLATNDSPKLRKPRMESELGGAVTDQCAKVWVEAEQRANPVAVISHVLNSG